MEYLGTLAVTKKVVDLFRYLLDGESRQWHSALIVIGSWVAGAGLAYLVGASSLAESVGLADANLADIVIAGIMAGSGAGVVHDLASGGVNIH